MLQKIVCSIKNISKNLSVKKAKNFCLTKTFITFSALEEFSSDTNYTLDTFTNDF